MNLTKISPESYGGGSPAVWRRDPVTMLVQGWRTENPGIDLPPGEDVVTLPALLAVDAVAALDGDTMAFLDLMRMLRTFATSAFRLETVSPTPPRRKMPLSPRGGSAGAPLMPGIRWSPTGRGWCAPGLQAGP